MNDLIAQRRLRIRRRLIDLQNLRNRVDDEITVLTASLGQVHERRSRHVAPPCATEQGYQYHRHRSEKCEECRLAHNAHERARAARKRLEKRRPVDVTAGQGPFQAAECGTIGDEPDRSVSALQPGSDHLLETTERG